MKLIRKLVPFVHPLLWRTDWRLKQAVWNHIYYSKEYRFIYFRIPKAANSTIALTLFTHMTGTWDRTLDPTERLYKHTGRALLRSGIILPRQLRGYLTFTFVRNPFARVLSAYLDKVKPSDKRFHVFLGVRRGPVSFREFLERLQAGYLTANVHWAPQVDLIPLAPNKLDFIGRVETIDTDLPPLLKRLFAGEARHILERRHNATGADRRLRQEYGPREVQLVRMLYAEDFACFYPDAEDPV